ncbi:hypothetical protein ceV_470 [Chrysochromulina ericina virus CeV-01B]|uniref:Uncharacterized protein n=1 Tax=Chrysochromulina ericina virus CeV-01B TaxID=3070830 RepID=A0A0N9R133_9VIRU|nr:hypothetical protein ceV_470 [Chrysochromulina ericina virus]ALH23376.1 hypothetical protein ceV_470 [Chrysochromulina ericina virus CeV-01B]
MFSTAENSMIHLNALTFNQLFFIIFIISIIIFCLGILFSIHKAISNNKYGDLRSIANICYTIYFFCVLVFVGYITFTASKVVLF